MTENRGYPGAESSSDRLPHKPTRESADGAERIEQVTGQRAEPTGKDNPDHLGLDRQEVGNDASSAKHPPHSTANDRGAAPVLPANASGSDAVTTEEQDTPIDDESMYDNRPGRDKDQPPSGSASRQG